MKLYATIEKGYNGKIEGVGDNKHLRIGLGAKNKQFGVILLDYLSAESSMNGKECAIMQVWGESGELCERQIITFESLKGNKQKGEHNCKKYTCNTTYGKMCSICNKYL